MYVGKIFLPIFKNVLNNMIVHQQNANLKTECDHSPHPITCNTDKV